jgi:hypothetical protein
VKCSWRAPQVLGSAERARLANDLDSRRAQERFWRVQEAIAGAAWRMLENLPSLPLQKAVDFKRSLARAPDASAGGSRVFYSRSINCWAH